ncbi:MAG TPA: ATP-binding protein, partial [Prevotella sp.]|nr:ATP-binding protein [Prevotella sp.]
DNCLSTLKHETMYYPSRIRQLIDGSDDNLLSIAELTDYYQALYAILSQQAMRQIGTLRLDAEMFSFLFDILRKLNQNEKPPVELARRDNRYTEATVHMTRLALTDRQCHDLFTAGTVHLDFLLCRQIAREMGEATNLRACGIAAHREDDTVVVRIVMPATCAKWVESSRTS